MAERRTAPNRDDFAVFRAVQTRLQDHDSYGHVNNAVHYGLIDTAVNGWLIEQGLLDLNESAIIGLVVETGCQYFAELKFPDTIHVGLRVGHLGRSSVRYEVGLFRNDETTAAAAGFFVHVYVVRASGTPCPIPDDTRAALEGLVV
ncbi:MAG: thioesterase family protein [Pseudomonadota bacterium]